LDIVNEFDIVSRADRPYVVSLLNLLRHEHGQPPPRSESDLNTDMSDKEILPAATFLTQLPGSPNGVNDVESALWPIPDRLYHHVGSLIVLTMRLDDDDQTQLKAFEIPPDLFGALLFTKLSVHRRAVYSRRICLLETITS
jgi:hypothetical protein